MKEILKNLIWVIVCLIFLETEFYLVLFIILIFLFKNLLQNLLNLYKFLNNINSDKIYKDRIEYLKKIELNSEKIDIWNEVMQEQNFQNYQFTKQFFEILFEKIKEEMRLIYSSVWNRFQRHSKSSILRSLLEKYKTLDIFSHIFYSQDLKQLLEIYKLDFDNGEFEIDFRNAVSDIIRIKIKKHLDNDWYLTFDYIWEYLAKYNDNQRVISYFFGDLQSKILNSEILLKDIKVMKEYWKEVFHKYKDIWNSELFGEAINFLLEAIQFNKDYDFLYNNILCYWLVDFEPVVFSELLYLFFTPYWDNRAIDTLNKKHAFWWQLMYWKIPYRDRRTTTSLKQTIQNFKKYFSQQVNAEELTQLKEQFQALIDEKTIDENKINYAKNYISLIEKLLAD